MPLTLDILITINAQNSIRVVRTASDLDMTIIQGGTPHVFNDIPLPIASKLADALGQALSVKDPDSNG